MITFELRHNIAKIKKFTSNSEIDLIKKELTFWQKNFMIKDGQLYKKDVIYNEKEHTIPIGYIDTLCNILKEKKISYEINDTRTYNFYLKKPTLINEFKYELHKTQKEALKAIETNYTGIIASATGSGKSTLIIKSMELRGGNILLIVPTDTIRESMTEQCKFHFGENLVSNKFPTIHDDFYLEEAKPKDPTDITEQDEPVKMKDKLASLFSKSKDKPIINETIQKLSKLHSQDIDMGDDSPEARRRLLRNDKYNVDSKQEKKEFKKKMKTIQKKSKQITIICWASLPSVSREFLKKIDTVIIDECHVAGIESVRLALVTMENAAFRYFFSATPWQDTKAKFNLLISAIGTNLIYDLGGKEAADEGITSRPKYILIQSPKPKKYIDPKKVKKNPRLLVLEGIIENESRNAMIVVEAIKLFQNNHNVFIAVSEISHLEILQERFKLAGIDILEVHSQLGKGVKSANLKTISSHNPDKNGGIISIGTMAVGVGADTREINAVILASGEKSSIRMLQRIGRGSRKTSEEFTVIDFYDWFNDILLERSKARAKTFQEEYGTIRNLDTRFGKYD